MELKKPLAYVTRDIERALGMAPAGLYYVISNDTAYGREIRARHPENVFLYGEGGLLDTYDLLALPAVQAKIAELGADLLVFQNTLRIERVAAEKGWSLLNPSASLSKEVEEKVTQVKWLGEDARLLPPHRIAELREVAFEGRRFVLQFNHAHTGQGTYIIDSAEALGALRDKFPYRECRVTEFVDGPVFTVNAVAGRDVVVGNPSYQITGIAPFTDLPFSTIGNDWSLPQRRGYEGMRIETVSIAQAVGARLKKSGWKGLFGIDVIYDPEAKKTYLLEINARQPASTAYESELQGSPSIFEAHLAALTGAPLPGALPGVSGAQIVKRVTRAPSKVDLAALESLGARVISYETDMQNKELFRIQTKAGIMEAHNALNSLGKSIASSCNQ